MRATLAASAFAIVAALTVGVFIDEQGSFMHAAVSAFNEFYRGAVETTGNTAAAASTLASSIVSGGSFSGNEIFTADELRQYDGTDESKPLLLVVLGEVFDVSSGKKFYGKGEGYGIFVGQDSSRSFHSGDWNDAKADVRDLNVMAIADVLGWRTFYRNHKEYRKAGVMVGLYYTADGQPTAALADVEALGDKAAAIKDGEEAKMKEHPGCDMLHNASTKTTRIACPSAEGDARFPRLISWEHPGTGNIARRCACISGRELSRGNLDIGDIAVYPGCKPEERECIIVQHL